MRARQCWVCSTKLVSVRQIRFGSSIKLVKFHFIQWLAVLLWCCDTETYWLSALFTSYRTLKSFFASSIIKQSLQIVYGPNKICWARCFVNTMNWVCYLRAVCYLRRFSTLSCMCAFCCMRFEYAVCRCGCFLLLLTSVTRFRMSASNTICSRACLLLRSHIHCHQTARTEWVYVIYKWVYVTYKRNLGFACSCLFGWVIARFEKKTAFIQ